MFFVIFFTSFERSQFENLCFFGRFGQLQTRGHASPHARLSIGAGPSARGVQGFGLLDETLSKHRSMISMDLNDSNDFNDPNDSWILGFLLLVSFSRSLSFALSLSPSLSLFSCIVLLMSFSAEHLCLIFVKTVKHAGLREVQLSTHVCFCFCFNLCPVECTKPLNCCMFMCVRVLSKLAPPNNVGR